MVASSGRSPHSAWSCRLPFSLPVNMLCVLQGRPPSSFFFVQRTTYALCRVNAVMKVDSEQYALQKNWNTQHSQEDQRQRMHQWCNSDVRSEQE